MIPGATGFPAPSPASAAPVASDAGPAAEAAPAAIDLPRLDIVLLAYNSARWIAPCLASVLASGYPHDRLRVIAVDNASGDGSEAEFLAAKGRLRTGAPGVTMDVIQSGANLGFSGGNNLGWRLGNAPLILFLNLDTEVRDGALSELVAGLTRHPDAAIAGCKMYFPGSHRLQHAGGQVFLNGMANHYFNSEEDIGQADEERAVDYVTGACLLVRREAMTRLGGFDEDYFPAYFEETDLCLRARRLGMTTVYVPTAVIVHHESPGLGGRRDPRFLRAIYEARGRFVAKLWTPADMVERWLPTERWWFGIVEGAEARPFVRRSYWQALRFILAKNWRLLFARGPLPPPAPPVLPQCRRGPGTL